MFDSFVFLPLSTRAYFKGRAYIKIIPKNHARSYFAGWSYYRGNTVAANLRDKKKIQAKNLGKINLKGVRNAYSPKGQRDRCSLVTAE